MPDLGGVPADAVGGVLPVKILVDPER